MPSIFAMRIVSDFSEKNSCLFLHFYICFIFRFSFLMEYIWTNKSIFGDTDQCDYTMSFDFDFFVCNFLLCFDRLIPTRDWGDRFQWPSAFKIYSFSFMFATECSLSKFDHLKESSFMKRIDRRIIVTIPFSIHPKRNRLSKCYIWLLRRDVKPIYIGWFHMQNKVHGTWSYPNRQQKWRSRDQFLFIIHFHYIFSYWSFHWFELNLLYRIIFNRAHLLCSTRKGQTNEKKRSSMMCSQRVSNDSCKSMLHRKDKAVIYHKIQIWFSVRTQRQQSKLLEVNKKLIWLTRVSFRFRFFVGFHRYKDLNSVTRPSKTSHNILPDLSCSSSFS